MSERADTVSNPEASRLRGLAVMVVDDSVLTVKKLSKVLEEIGHRIVHTAANGAAAVEAYGTVHPDLVTMDITMPDMDGIEATRRIVAEHPNAIVIIVTSHGQEEMVAQAIGAGAKGYILKPFDAAKLQDLIGKLVAKSGPAAAASETKP